MSTSLIIRKSKTTVAPAEIEDDKTSEIVDVINVQKQKQRVNEGYIDGDDESDDSDGSYDDEDDYDSELEYQADNSLQIEVLAQGEDEDFLPLMRQFQTLHRFNDLPVNGNIDANMN